MHISLCPVPDFIVEYLIDNRFQGVLEKLAKSPATMPEILEQLAKCSDSSIKSCLVENPKTSIDTLRLLVKDAIWMARKKIAANPQTPVDIIEQLAKDPDSSVRSQVAENLNTPINILSELAKDTEATIARNAIRNMAIQTNKYDDFLAKYAPNAYIKNSTADETIYKIPSETLAKIVDRHPDFVANYPHTSENLLLELSKHKRYSIREKVAENSNTRHITIFNLEKLENIHTFQAHSGNHSEVEKLEFSPDGRLLASKIRDNKLKLWTLIAT